MKARMSTSSLHFLSAILLVALCCWNCERPSSFPGEGGSRRRLRRLGAADVVAPKTDGGVSAGRLVMPSWTSAGSRLVEGRSLRHVFLHGGSTVHAGAARKLLQDDCPGSNSFAGQSVEELTSAILEAFASDDVLTVAAIYCAGLDPDTAVEPNGDSLLTAAILENAIESAKFLIAVGADVNHIATKPKTPLGAAAIVDNAVLVGLLRANGAELEVPQTNGLTPLGLAAFFDSPSAAQALINSGANIEARANLDLTPLMVAALRSSNEALQVLVDSGADLEAVSDGGTALHFAAKAGNLEGARILIANGASTSALIPELDLTPEDVICAATGDQPCPIEVLTALRELLKEP